MRILHIMASAAQGGAEIYSTDVMLALHEQGVEQCVVLPENAARKDVLVKAGMRVDTGCLAFPFAPWQRFQIAQLATREKPDIIHCWMRRAAQLAPVFAGPVIGWVPSYQDPQKFPRVTHFVGITKDTVAHIAQNGIAPENVSLIPTFSSVTRTPPVSRASLNTPEGAPLLLALSRLHPVKGIDTLLKALARLPGAYLWLAGDGPLRNEMESLAARLGVSERVRFLGWREDRGALLGAVDICVLPSRQESLGTVILEAWALDTPVMATAAPGPAALIENGVNGMVTPIDDVEALADTLKALIASPEQRKKLAEGGRESWQRNFTRERVTQQWLELYARLGAFPAISHLNGINQKKREMF